MRTPPARSRILNRAMAPVWALLLGAAVVIPYGRSVQAQAGTGGSVGHVALRDAHQPGSLGPAARRQRADRVRLGQPRDRNHLPRGLVEPTGGRHYDTNSRLGHVLQRHGHAAGRPSLRRWRQPAVRLSGLRVGYGVATPANVRSLHGIQLPDSVNAVGSAAAIAALDDTEYVQRCRGAKPLGYESLANSRIS